MPQQPKIEDIGKDYATSAYYYWVAATNIRRHDAAESSMSSINYLLERTTPYPKIFTRLHNLKDDYGKRRSA